MYFRTAFFLFFLACGFSAVTQTKEIDSLKSALHRTSIPDTTRANIFNQIAFAYWSVNSDSIIALSKKAEQFCRSIRYLKGEAEAVRNIGSGYRLKGDYEQAMQCFRQALSLSEKANYQRGIAGCYNSIAVVYNNRGKFDEALRFHVKAVAIREKIGDKENLSTSFNNIGVIYTNLGRYSEALDYYLKSLTLCEQINYKMGIAARLNNIGYIYEKLGQNEKALESQLKALQIQKEIGDRRGFAFSLTQLGKLYLNLGRDSLALDFQLRALQTAEEVMDEQLMARVLIKIAHIYFKKGNLAQSLNYYNRTKFKMEKIGDKSGISQVLSELAQLYLSQKEYKLALASATTSLKIGLEIRNLEMIVPANQTLSAVYESMGNSTAALYHFKQYKLYSDSLNNREIEKKSIESQARYEFQKKEEQLKGQQRNKEAEYEREASVQRSIIFSGLLILFSVLIIALLAFYGRLKIKKAYESLKKANLEIQKQREELRSMNALKERLLSVVSHDVRGPINSLGGMLHLLSQNAIPPGEEKEIMSAISIQLGQVRDFLETLLHWVKQQVVNAAPDSKDFMVNQTVSQTLELFAHAAEMKKINFSTSLERCLSVYADEEMIKIVLRNLVSNAIKFCSEGDSIEIIAKSNTERTFAKISVIDTGKGIPMKNLAKLFGVSHLSTKGTGNEIGTGLGLLLCKQNIEQNGGEINVESEEGKGTHFWFTIPLRISINSSVMMAG